MHGYQGTEGTRPFAGAGWYYAQYRDRVSAAFMARLAEHLNWSVSDRVLDLGAGPAQLSLLAAAHVAEVVAFDPEADMLSEGQRRAEQAGVSNITFVQASSDDLPALRSTLGMFRAVLMGASFHWMTEKDRVIADLSAMSDPDDSAVAFVRCQRLEIPPVLQEAQTRIKTLLNSYLADVPEGPHPRGRHDPFEDILARSAFPRVETVELVYQQQLRPTVASLIGAEYSISHILTRLGDRRQPFEQAAHAALADLGDIGDLTVTFQDEAMIGRR